MLAASSAKANIVFCNEFPAEVWVAIAYQQEDGSWLSRGWLSVETGKCYPFDTAIHVKTFYFRGESKTYHHQKSVWGRVRTSRCGRTTTFNTTMPISGFSTLA
jgi:uncharacterized membrane protein